MELPADDIGDHDGRIVGAELVGRDLGPPAGELVRTLECERRECDQVGDGRLLEWSVERDRARQLARSQRRQVPWVEEVLHEVDGGQDRAGNAERANALLDLEL